MKTKTINHFPVPVDSFGKSLMNLSPADGGGAGGGGEITFTPEQETLVAQRIAEAVEKKTPDLQTSLQFIKNAGGRAYLSNQDFEKDIHTNLSSILSEKIENPNEVQKSLLKFKSSLIGEVLSPVDQTIKELTGVEKEATEKTRDYAKRALDTIKKDGSVDESTVRALQAKITEANNDSKSWQDKYNDLLAKENINFIQSQVDSGIPIGTLDYTEQELKVMLPGLKAQLNESFEFKKDETGTYAINKQTGFPELDQTGNRKTVSSVVSGFISSLEGLKLKKDSNGGAGLPGSTATGSQLNSDEVAKRETIWKTQLNEKNMVGHERQAFIMRKELGLPISERAKQQWPELK